MEIQPEVQIQLIGIGGDHRSNENQEYQGQTHFNR